MRCRILVWYKFIPFPRIQIVGCSMKIVGGKGLGGLWLEWAWQYSKSENITETKLEAQESACQISYSFLPNPSIVGPIVSEPNPNSLPYIVSQIPKPSSNRFRDLSVHSNRRTWLLAHSNAHRPPTNFQTYHACGAHNLMLE